MNASASPSFAEKLLADGPATDRAGKMGLYSWLIGRWEMEAIVIADDGTKHSGRGEIHFGWVLEGRAIQDVWILPGFFHGTTLRVYDPGLDAWHILWSDPVKQLYIRQIGRARGNDIVQEGNAEDGAMHRWSFTEIMLDAFRWRGERSPIKSAEVRQARLRDDGASWHLQADFRARRVHSI